MKSVGSSRLKAEVTQTSCKLATTPSTQLVYELTLQKVEVELI